MNGIAIELRQVQRDGDTLLADLCYQLPTPALNWMLGIRPGDVVVQAQANTILMSGTSLLGWQTSATGDTIGRCDQVHFSVPAALDLTRLTLRVERLVTSTSESPDCRQVQDRLNRSGSGIVIACHPGDYSFSFEVVTRPVTLTANTANQLAADAFSDIVRGPWVFSAGLPPAAPTTQPNPAASATAAEPRAQGVHPDTLAFTRMDDLNGTTSYQLLSLDCLSRPGGCVQAPRATIPMPPTDVFGPAVWSPDGNAFVFLAGMNGRADIYRVNADGTGLVDLTPTSGTRSGLSWSPDGQLLLFEQPGAARNSDEIWLMRPDGSAARKIADGGQPAWMPDGRQIVFDMGNGDPAVPRSDLYRLDIAAPGGQPVRLTDTPNLKNSLSVAPGGRYLAFTAQVQGQWAIFVLSLDDATLPLRRLDAPGVTRVSPPGMDATGPVWSPTGS